MAEKEFPIVRIEMWHGVLLLTLGVALAPVGMLDPWALLLGGLFMGINLLLLGFGIRWILTPLSTRGRVRAGIMLLVLKLSLFLVLLWFLFSHVHLHAPSFAVGVSTLLVAILLERLWATTWRGD